MGSLKLAGELFQMAGLTLPKAPVLGNGTDLVSLNADRSTIATFTSALRSVADAHEDPVRCWVAVGHVVIRHRRDLW